MKIPLKRWAESKFSPSPSLYTLRKWSRDGYIFPAPVKVGRSYYVDPDAKYVERNRYGT